MFAVVEFEKREIAIVPIIWLVENETKSYWPRAFKTETILDYVKTKKTPKTSWPKYVVVRVHHLIAHYDEAENHLQKLVEESSSDNNATNDAPLSRKEFVDDDSSDETTKTSKRTKIYENSSKNGRCNTVSSDEFSDDNSQSASPSVSLVSTITVSSTPSETYRNPELVASTSNFSTKTDILELILEKVEHIKAVQDQQCILLSNIQRMTQTGTVQQLERPTNMPHLPVSNKHDYRALEDFLGSENNALYMRRRLAAVGGASVRNTVMNILKFVLTNKVAMKFSFSGREKRPFKNTKIMEVISEAVKLSYNGREGPDLTDTEINRAVADWLKLAKHRYMYNKK